MTVFLWIMFIKFGINTLIWTTIACTGESHTVTYEPYNNIINMLWGIGFCVWSGILLFN